MKKLALLLCLLPTLAFGKTAPQFETAKVISQDIGSSNAGTAVMPLGTGLIGVPITRNSDIVVIETATQRLTLAENGRKFIILPVNGTINFYRDGKWFIVLDTEKKKHKFGLLHLENIAAEAKKTSVTAPPHPPVATLPVYAPLERKYEPDSAAK